MTDKVHRIKADDPDDFMDRAHAVIGDGEALGVTDFDLGGSAWKLKDGKVVSGDIEVATTVTRALWAGPATGGVKLSKEADKAMGQINDWIETHEQKHVKLAKDIVAKAKLAFKKNIVGKTDREAQRMLDEIGEQITDAYKKLDAKEGKLTVTKGSSGAYTLKAGPA